MATAVRQIGVLITPNIPFSQHEQQMNSELNKVPRCPDAHLLFGSSVAEIDFGP
jgi:hypothetical protein